MSNNTMLRDGASDEEEMLDVSGDQEGVVVAEGEQSLPDGGEADEDGEIPSPMQHPPLPPGDAGSRLAHTNELAEMILLHLPLIDLVRVQCVCRRAREMALFSSKIQSALFLRPYSGLRIVAARRDGTEARQPLHHTARHIWRTAHGDDLALPPLLNPFLHSHDIADPDGLFDDLDFIAPWTSRFTQPHALLLSSLPALQVLLSGGILHQLLLQVREDEGLT